LAQELAQELALANSQLPHWTPVQHRRFRTNRCHVSTAKRGQVSLADQPEPTMRDLPQNNLSYPVLITIGPGLGSGFLCTTPDKIALVTAKHVLFDKSGALVDQTASLTAYAADDQSTKLEFRLDLPLLAKNRLIRAHATADVAVIEIGTVDTADTGGADLHLGVSKAGEWPDGKNVVGCPSESYKKAADVLISNEVFLFGYPVSLGQGLQLDRSRPLLRKGIVAGKTRDGRIVIDCPVYFGNSGGLVVEVTHLAGKRIIHAVGIAVELVPFVEEIYSKQFAANVGLRIENSGYSIVEPMDRVLELL
jgi:hypothetical protein